MEPGGSCRRGSARRTDRFPAAVLLAVWLGSLGGALGQVRNLRFEDTDASTGTIGGWVYWEQPADDSTSHHYAVYLAQDNAGTNQVQVGQDVGVGAWTSKLEIAAGYDVATNSYTHILVYLKDVAGTESNPANACLFDSPDDYARRFYITITGYSSAVDTKATLVDTSACHAMEPFVAMDTVATVISTGNDYVEEISEIAFDNTDEQSESAAYQLIFDSGKTLSEIETALSGMGTPPTLPIPLVFTGTSADSGYSWGYVKATSALAAHVPERPDVDTGRYLARSAVAYSIAHAASVNREGEVRLQTTSTQVSSAIQEMADVYFGSGVKTVTFSDLGASSSDLTAIDGRSTASQAQCWQITSSCTTPGGCYGSCTHPSL